MIRHAWLQKHPSPSAADGEFHWHPAGGDRELRASVVECARGVEPPAVVWELAPGRVVWAQMFAATAPRDRRRYTGMVLTVVERAGSSAAELLALLALPAAAPWTEDAEATMHLLARGARSARAEAAPATSLELASATAAASSLELASVAAATSLELASVDDLASRARSLLPEGAMARAHVGADSFAVLPAAVAVLELASATDLASLAHSLSSDVPSVRAHVGADSFAALPAAVAALERCLPSTVQARGRRGVWAGAVTSAAAREDCVARLLARACSEPRSRAALGWRLLCELAETTSRSVDALGERMVTQRMDRTRSAASIEASALHAWGRGRLDGSGPADELVARFADELALRVVASLAADRDPAPVIAAARWHALLPADRRTLLFRTCARRCPSLRAFAGGLHA